MTLWLKGFLRFLELADRYQRAILKPPPLKKLLQPQTKTYFEKIEAQLEYNPTLFNQKQ